MEPARYQMSQVNLARLFKFVNHMTNNPATSICRHGCVEVKSAMRAIGTGERARDRAFEGFGAFLTKRRRDADSFAFALAAHIVAGSNAFTANCAKRRIQKRDGRFEQFKLLKSDHVSAT